jgi:tRNA(Ile)-lysidine synthase
MLAARADAQPAIEWPGVRLERHAGLLTLYAAGEATGAAAVGGSVAPGELTWTWRAEPRCRLPEGLGQIELRADIYGPVNLAALPARLTIRWRRGGERLVVAPGRPRRTLKSLLRESGLPPGERARLPLVYGGARLLAVADLWLDESVQAAPGARRRARFVWTKAGIAAAGARPRRRTSA